MCSLALPAMAFAQPEAPKEAADDMERQFGDREVETETVTKSVTTEEETTTMIVEDEDGAPDQLVTVVEETTTVVEEVEEVRPFLDGLSWMVMASAFYRIDGYLNEGVRAGTYNSLGYPYTQYNGFGLNFVGGMAQYTGEKFGVTVDLRWGTGAPLLTPLVPVKQGYVSWMPSDKVTFDFGFFDTIFGGEVADEWQNANYTRGALYFLRQPFNHMGIRSAFAFSDNVGFTLMVTNGGVLGGTPVDNNETPTIGWQFALGGDAVGFYFGGQHGAGNDNDNKNWENFFDWVLSASAGIFTLVANGDYQLTPTAYAADPTVPTGGAFAYGHSLQLIFDATSKFSIGLRGEHLSGNEDFRNNYSGGDTGLATATLTFRYKPVEYLVLSLEGRGEWNTREVYFSRTAVVDETSGDLIPNQKKNYSAILGFTAFMGNYASRIAGTTQTAGSQSRPFAFRDTRGPQKRRHLKTLQTNPRNSRLSPPFTRYYPRHRCRSTLSCAISSTTPKASFSGSRAPASPPKVVFQRFAAKTDTGASVRETISPRKWRP
jgi:hypothetical protein